MITEDLRSFLVVDAGVLAVVAVSSDSPQRVAIHPVQMPKNRIGYPSAVFTLDGEERQQMMSGFANELVEAYLTIDCYALTYLQAHALATAIQTAIEGYRGAMGSSTIEHVRVETKIDGLEDPTNLHRVSLQVLIAYS